MALRIGYDKAAEIAYYAFKNKMKIKDVVKEKRILSEKEIEEIFDTKKMI
ncbi:hypothetical protein [Deferribacter abyssi]